MLLVTLNQQKTHVNSLSCILHKHYQAYIQLWTQRQPQDKICKDFQAIFWHKAKPYADHLDCHGTTLSQKVLGIVTNATPRRKDIKLNFNIIFLSNWKYSVYQRLKNANYVVLLHEKHIFQHKLWRYILQPL